MNDKNLGIFGDRFAVRPASPVRSLRCETSFACETTWLIAGGFYG